MIEAWAERMAVSIKRSNEQETISVAVMKYALTIVINFLIPCVLVMLVGVISGRFSETLLSLCALVAMRAVSGGYHFNSMVACIGATIVVAAAPPHIPFPQEWIVYGNVVSLAVMAVLAPANIKGYARMPEKYFPLMRGVAVALVGCNFIIQSPTLVMIFLIQSFSLFFTNKKGG